MLLVGMALLGGSGALRTGGSALELLPTPAFLFPPFTRRSPLLVPHPFFLFGLWEEKHSSWFLPFSIPKFFLTKWEAQFLSCLLIFFPHHLGIILFFPVPMCSQGRDSSLCR